MNTFSYRNRIALHYLAATASMIALVFALIYFVVRFAVYTHLDTQLEQVAHKHAYEVIVKNDKISFVNKIEWEEREHMEVEVNPVFIEVHGLGGELMDKSPNLKTDQLGFNAKLPVNKLFNTQLNDQRIRQIKVAVVRNNKTFGYITAAVPIDGYLLVLDSLRNILLISFPFLMLLLFFVARFLAGKSIKPVKYISDAAQNIKHDNLDQRIPIPLNKDELFFLATAINDLLSRIEGSMQREKQFTSDAAHQLKTPLAVMKGTFEVLVRKPREKEEYIAKINTGIDEIDRMSKMVDQLLLLARVDSSQQKAESVESSLVGLIDEVIQRLSRKIATRKISIVFNPQHDFLVQSDPFLLDLILENLISNAVKYSLPEQNVEIRLIQNVHTMQVMIIDSGIGIKKEELHAIFNPFFRSDALAHREIMGYGLGLSIVKRACNLAAIELNIESEFGKGTAVSLIIKNA